MSDNPIQDIKDALLNAGIKQQDDREVVILGAAGVSVESKGESTPALAYRMVGDEVQVALTDIAIPTSQIDPKTVKYGEWKPLAQFIETEAAHRAAAVSGDVNAIRTELADQVKSSLAEPIMLFGEAPVKENVEEAPAIPPAAKKGKGEQVREFIGKHGADATIGAVVFGGVGAFVSRFFGEDSTIGNLIAPAAAIIGALLTTKEGSPTNKASEWIQTFVKEVFKPSEQAKKDGGTPEAEGADAKQHSWLGAIGERLSQAAKLATDAIKNPAPALG